MNEFPEARPEPPQADAIAGEFLTETFDYDDGRQVTVYVPPVPPEAIVFAGDGQMIFPWGQSLEAADVPSTMIGGVHRVADETLRLHEYSPNFDPERFAAHERFFVEDVSAWTRSRFGVARCPSSARRSSASRRAANSRLLSAFDIPSSTAQSSQPRPAVGTGRLTQCPLDCRAHTSSPAPWSLSFSRTRLGGRAASRKLISLSPPKKPFSRL